ncbi:hypothetical protein HPB51_004038 [Rhipicephalus microplus]|uniref:Uncharacterized protein n=1 Tax=Rhipicephalus microplus TaxID=6941 RepID=A0A9J6EWW9_RHIMP|nr:hypothetical protein HPB51_004038 [Rhipicephalus microplus]
MGDKMGLFIHYLSTFASGFATGFVESWELTLVIMSVTPLLAFASAFLGNMVSQSAAKEQEKYAQAGAVALEVLSKIRTVAAFCSQYSELQRYMTALEAGKTASRRKYIAMAFGFGLTFVVLYGAYALAFWYSSLLVAAARLDPGRAFIVFFAVMVGSFSLGNALPQLNSIAVAQMAAGRAFEVIDRRPDIDSYSELGVQLKQFTANLAFKNISFFYPRCPNHLITLDGVNLRSLSVRWLRSEVSLVSERPTLFNYSIAENIQFGQEDTTMVEVVEMAKLVGMHEFIKSLPKGYETEIGEQGCQLSEGQRQRLAIARAMVKTPRVLLLDNATGALDGASEAHLLRTIAKGSPRRATVVVTQRLSTLREADMVYVMDEGHIVEQGKHDDLVAKKGFYFQLMLSQLTENEDADAPPPPPVSRPPASRQDEDDEEERLRRRRKALLLESISPFDRECSRLADDFIKEDVELPSARKILQKARPDCGWFFLVSLASLVVGASLPVFAVFYSEIFNEARRQVSYLPETSFAEVARQGAAPRRPPAPVWHTRSEPAVTPSAPSAVAASAAPPSKKHPPTSGLGDAKALSLEARPSKQLQRSQERLFSASLEAMDTTPSVRAQQAPKDRRDSVDRSKKEKSRVTAPGKCP